MVTLAGVSIAVVIVLIYANPEESETMRSNTLATVALIAQPFLLAGGSIAMRKMRKMPE